MSDAEKKVKEVKPHPCGCKEVSFEDGSQHYEACLGCALATAGNMLVMAGKRIHEATSRKREQSRVLVPGAKIEAHGSVKNPT